MFKHASEAVTARIAVALCFVCLTVANVFAADTKFNAGFSALSSSGEPPAMGIWYPSTSAETAGKLGPFRPTWAWDGDAASGVFPIVILSHGHTGRYRNHRQTAALLARNGYIVAAPSHLDDPQMASKKKIVSVVSQRVAELQLALSTLRTHPIVEKIADTNRVGAIGYSLGTATALYAAGATPQMALIDQHCKQFNEKDSNFCGDGWSLNLTAKEFLPTESPINFSAIALVAPMGVPFSVDALRQPDFISSRADIALFRLGNDEELRYPYHAEHLYNLLGDNVRVYKTFENVHHYAFISPFPQWLLDEEYIPVAIDPENFDRAAFISDINNDILNFFNGYL